MIISCYTVVRTCAMLSAIHADLLMLSVCCFVCTGHGDQQSGQLSFSNSTRQSTDPGRFGQHSALVHR